MGSLWILIAIMSLPTIANGDIGSFKINMPTIWSTTTAFPVTIFESVGENRIQAGQVSIFIDLACKKIHTDPTIKSNVPIYNSKKIFQPTCYTELNMNQVLYFLENILKKNRYTFKNDSIIRGKEISEYLRVFINILNKDGSSTSYNLFFDDNSAYVNEYTLRKMIELAKTKLENSEIPSMIEFDNLLRGGINMNFSYSIR